MAKPELGTKRLCTNCSAKFYDLNKDPIVCPKCHTVMEAAMVAPRARPETAAVADAAAVAEEEVAAPETAEAEFVSLEEADAEVQGKKPEGETVEGGEEDVELEDEGAVRPGHQLVDGALDLRPDGVADLLDRDGAVGE